jgi:predicted transposase YbfD/YdcC
VSIFGTITGHFAEVKDPRIERTKEHPLLNILVIAICGVICGADGWVGIEEYGKSKQDWLAGFLDLKNGIPSHDTFGRVFAHIDAEQFQKGFVSWVQAISEITQGELVALDGKQMRGSHERGIGKGAITMVSAWAVQNHLVLGQRKVDNKSNEITAIPKLLKMLELAGCIVTIDAMGCQTEIAAQIVEQGADYVLALKGNQGTLYENASWLFTQLRQEGFQDADCDYHRTVDGDHGCIEIRECWVLDPRQWPEHFRTLADWKDLRSITMIQAERRVDEKITKERRLYISSKDKDARLMLRSVRWHWGIENSLHWVLDVAFDEDRSRIRSGNAPQNMAVLRHIALNLLRQDKSAKVGIQIKRFKCALDESFLLKVLQAGFDSS